MKQPSFGYRCKQSAIPDSSINLMWKTRHGLDPTTQREILFQATAAVLIPDCDSRVGRLRSTGSFGRSSIWRTRKLFSSVNWSSSVRSSKNLGKNLSNRSRLLIRIRCTATDLFGLATKTCLLSVESGGPARPTHLENVETLVLHHLPIVAQEFHAKLEIFSAIHIGHHHIIICAVQQDLSEKLDTLSLGHVRV